MRSALCCLALAASAAAGARAQRTTADAGRPPAPAAQGTRPASKEFSVPRPVLVWRGLDTNVKGSDGKSYVGVTLGVSNYASYPAVLFARAPELPPCGANASASRSWLRVYARQTQKEVYSYCALSGPSELRAFSFNVARADLPAEVYVVLEDRAAGRRYHSNCLKTASGKACDEPGGGLVGTEVLAAPAVTPEAGFQAVHGREPNPEEAKFWRAAVLKDGLTQEQLNQRILQRLITNPDVWAHGEMKMIVQRAYGAAGKGSPSQQQTEYWTNRILMGTAYHKTILDALRKQ
jgi:hypothetical protein